MNSEKPKKIETKYHFILLSQQEFISNLILEEIFREKAGFCNKYNIELDYWIIFRPKFLTDIYPTIVQNTIYYTLNKNNIQYENEDYHVVILTRDYEYINWIKLRLGYFEPIELPSYLTPEKSLLIAELNLIKEKKEILFDSSLKELEILKSYTARGKEIKINGIYGQIIKENLPLNFSLLEHPKLLEEQVHPEILIKQYSQLLSRIIKLKRINSQLELQK